MSLQSTKLDLSTTVDWRRFALRFLGVLFIGAIAIYLFILLVDPYDVIPFSLPIDRRIVSISDRFMYPQIVRSKRFDLLIIGTSTSRLLDPQLLDRLFHVRIANLSDVFWNGLGAKDHVGFVSAHSGTAESADCWARRSMVRP